MVYTNKKMRQGTVVSNKMERTGVVLVKRTIQHPIYKRTVRISKKYKFHDPENMCNIGDIVRVIECRPMSRDKRWKLLEVIKQAV